VLSRFFRDQGVYLSIALVVSAVFWSIGQPANPFTVILYALSIRNLLSPAMQWLHALYEKPSPYDLLVFLALLICIAGVSGKGVPAALLMANVQASLRASVRDFDSPARVCGILNSMLCESVAADKFVTFFCGVLDAGTRRFR
jgi:serine phosphatase RsbU (regulator of sigma subunit)